MHIVLHVNPSQPHQIEHGQWLAEGFKRQGLKSEITFDQYKQGDIHIVSGPHYALDMWKGHKTILLDRAYYHEGVSKWKSMDWVSLGWLRPDGGRYFRVGSGRTSPVPKDPKSEGGTIFLADYEGPIERADTVRLHPAKEDHKESLVDVLGRHKRAIGYCTTALATAGLEGLEIICKDKRNIMYEDNWLELLPYADWRYDEIMNGDAWEHLREFLD